MTVRRAFEKNIAREMTGDVATTIKNTQDDKAAELALYEEIEFEQAQVAHHDELGDAISDLNTQVGELIETLALMKHPNQRPALRQLAQEVPKLGDSDAVRVATLATLIGRARIEFKKGGA
jgi:hypothetical protein